MRQNKTDTRKLRHLDSNIKSQEHGIRFKRFLGDETIMEHVYRPIGGKACSGTCRGNKNANVLLAQRFANQNLFNFENLAKEFLGFFNEIINK